MPMSFHRTALISIALGCILQVFALTEIMLNDGGVARGSIVSETADAIVLNIDGNNVTIARSTIKEIRGDGSQSMSPATTSTYADEAQPESAPTYENTETQTEVATPPPQQNYNTAPTQQSYTPTPTQELSAPVQESPAPETVVPSDADKKVLGRAQRENVSIGVDLFLNMDSQFENDKENETEDHTVESNLYLKPYVGIRTSDILELRPALVFGRSRQSEDHTQDLSSSSSSSSSGSYKTESYSSSNTLGFDFGLFFYPIRGSFFRFVIGPAVGWNMTLPPKQKDKITSSGTSSTTEFEYDKFVNMNIPIHVPFSFDFVVAEHVGFRLSSELFDFNINILSIEDESGNPDEYSEVNIDTNLDFTKTITQLSIGVFFLF